MSLLKVDEIQKLDGSDYLASNSAQPYIFDTTAAYKAFAATFPVGKVIHLLDRDAEFVVIAGVGTATGFSIIASDVVSQSISLTKTDEVNIRNLGAEVGTDIHPVCHASIELYGYIHIPKGEWILEQGIVVASARRVRIIGAGWDETKVTFSGATEYALDTKQVAGVNLTINDITFLCTEAGHGFWTGESNGGQSVVFNIDRLSLTGAFSGPTWFGGFDSPSGVITAGPCIYSTYTRSKINGPTAFTAPTVGLTTTLTAVGINLVGNFNTTVEVSGEVNIRGFRIGLKMANAWTVNVARCSLENNFINIASYLTPGVGATSSNNYITECYHEFCGYSLGGAGIAYDPDDVDNTERFGQLQFNNGYHQGIRSNGGTKQENEPDMSKGRIGFFQQNATESAGRKDVTDPTRFQGANIVYSRRDQIVWHNPDVLYDQAGEVLGPIVGFNKGINNAALDKKFVSKVTSSSAGFSCEYILAASQERIAGQGVNGTETIDPTALVTRMRINEGNMYLSGGGAYNTSGADFAEMFEWADGNVNNEDRVGFTIVLTQDGLIEKAIDETQDIIGVVSAIPTIVGNNWTERWHGKYITDDFGRQVRGDDGSPLISKDYQEGANYLSRDKRIDWATIGLLGRLRVRAGCPVPASWRKLRDVSDDVAEYLVV